MRTWVAGVAILIALMALPRSVAAQTSDETATAAFKDDVHAAAGLKCETCHTPKGNRQGPYDAPPRTAVASLCARCHSDAAYIRQFNPQLRIDQFSQYLSSTHGKRMAAGEVRVATCTDCHGAHGVKRVQDSRSPVTPANVAKTCARCHADEQRMSAFSRKPTAPVDWFSSVHAAALLKRGDTSAPTCSSCHGSHGATPPGVTAVANVCAQCHGREADLFRESPKKEIFDAIGQAECLVCHSNHRIESPKDAWIGLSEGAVCAQCHDDTSAGAQQIRDMRRQLDRLSAGIAGADAALARAERSGMLVDEGRAALRAAREHQVQARVLLHSFAAERQVAAAELGVTAAQRASGVGTAAMSELQVRRRGLAAATLVILAFLVTLGVKIRRLEPPAER